MDEKKKVIEDVDKDRKYAIDAAIVRTMKSRKVLNHQHVRSSPPSSFADSLYAQCTAQRLWWLWWAFSWHCRWSVMVLIVVVSELQ